MQTTTLKKRFPLSAPAKTAFWSLIGCACTIGLLAINLGFPDGFGLLIPFGLVLCIAGVLLLRVRWIPAICAIMSVLILIVMFVVTPFPWFHLTHPQPDYLPFMLDILIVVLLITAGGTSLVTVIQNYLSPTGTTAEWLKPVWGAMLGVILGALLLGVIQAPPSAASTNGEATVHMGPGSFIQSSVTVTKGSKLLFIDDGAFTHNLTNGTWANNAVITASEPGAPSVKNQSINSGQAEIGPFTTAGTFHIACTIHQGMTLTITVK